MHELQIAKYKAMVSEDTQTMKSTDLHKFVYEATGKFKSLGDFNVKIKSVLQSHIDDGRLPSSLDSRGYVKCYTMNEVQCNMIMASIDVSHLELMSQVFVAVKNHVEELTPIQLMEKANLILLGEVETSKAKTAKVVKLLEQAEIISEATKYTNDTYSVDEFCKIISSKLEDISLGRTTAYIILRSMKLVEKTSTKPTQYGMKTYLDYRSHDYGFSTRIHVDKADNLIKFMIKHLQKEYELNTELNFPMGEF